MFYKILIFTLCLLPLRAFELPTIEIVTENKPKIVIFDAQSKVVKDKSFYEVRWKTINATDVNITFLGKVDLSGSLTVTKAEYNRGPITSTASSKNNPHIDKVTINSEVDKSKTTPMIHDDSEDTQSYYNTMPVRGVSRPINRRRRY